MTYQLRLQRDPFDFSHELGNYDNGLFESELELEPEFDEFGTEFVEFEEEEEVSPRPRGAGPVGRGRPPPHRPRPPRRIIRPWRVSAGVIHGPSTCTCPEESCPQHGSEYIRWVQSTLNRLLGMRLPLNGVLTAATRSAIRRFQEREKLPVTGIVGPDTERALIAARSGQSAGAGATRPVEPGMMEPPEPAATPPEPGMNEPAEPASTSSDAEFEFEWEEEDNRSSPDSTRWVLPADVRAAGEAQSVRYDSPPAWAGDPGNCTGSFTQGAAELKKHILANFQGVTRIGGYNCRRNSANGKETSVHGVGRALDIYIPMVGGRANSAVGDPVANWLILNASAIGIQLIIWNRVKWSGHRSAPKDRSYDPSPHTDHIHAELNNDGAGRKTAWFRRSQGGVGQPSTAGAKPPAELVRFAQRVLNATERERLDDDGNLGRLTRDALTRFRTRYGLGPGGVLDGPTELALVQRTIEELAQQSIFPQLGVLDTKTGPAIARFKSERGLGFDATMDAATRAALTQALQARSSSASSSPSGSPSPAGAATGGKVDPSVVARIDTHRERIERIAQEADVSPHVLRGIIAAESGGKEKVGANTRGYKGLMQCGNGEEQLVPEGSLRCGAKKYRQFTASMQKFFRDILKQNFDALPEDTRLRIVMAGYNAGPVTVQRAMRFAGAAGDLTRWLAPEHYLRALLSTGAYNPVESVLAWCLEKGHLSGDTLASDLARLSGKPLDEIRSLYAPAGKWNTERLAKALRPLLFKEKDSLKNNGSAPFEAVRSRATPSLFCAARYKQAHTPGYLDKIVRYKQFYAARG